MAHTYKRLRGKGATDFPRLDQAHPYDQYNNQYPYDGPGHGDDSAGLRYRVQSVSMCVVRWSLESSDRPFWNSTYPTTSSNTPYVPGAEIRDKWFDDRSDVYECGEALAPLPNNSIRIDIPYEKALHYNYLVVNGYRMEEPGDTWVQDRRRVRYFYFIDNCEFVAQDTTNINVTLDAWTTYMMMDTIQDNAAETPGGPGNTTNKETRPVKIARVAMEQGHAPMALSYTDKDVPFEAGKMDYLTGVEPYSPSTDTSKVASSTFTPYGIGDDYLVLAIKGYGREVADSGGGRAKYTRIFSRGLIIGDDQDGTTPLIETHETAPSDDLIAGGHPTMPYASWSGGPLDDNVGYTGGVSGEPHDIGYDAIAIKKTNSAVLMGIFRHTPSLYNRISAAFILPESVIFPNGDADKRAYKVNPGRVTDNSIYVLPEYTDSIVATIMPDKDQFDYPSQYRDLAKLYTLPYAWFEVTDGNGTTSTIKVEDVYTNKMDPSNLEPNLSVDEEDMNGGMKIREQVSLIYPFLRSKVFLQGVKGGGKAQFKFRRITKTDPQTPPDSTWTAFTEWEIPVYGLWADAGAMKAAASQDTNHANAIGDVVGYRIARQGALTSYANTIIGANTASDNSYRSLNNSFNNTKMEISTSYGNGSRSAETGKNNAQASNDTSRDNAGRSADTGLANAQQGNQLARDNAVRSNDTSRSNAVRSANTATRNARSSAATAKTNASATASTSKSNANQSANTALANTQASNGTMFDNTAENIATSKWTNAKTNSTTNTAANNNILLLHDYGEIDSNLTQDSLKASSQSTITLNNLNNAQNIVGSGISAAGAALSGDARGAVSSMTSAGISSVTSALSLETILSSNAALSQASVTANFQKWKANRAHTQVTTANDIENRTSINERMNSTAYDIANRNKNTSNANAWRSSDTSKTVAAASANTGLANANRSADTSVGNADTSANTSIANATNSANTSNFNAQQSLQNQNAMAQRSADTSQANAEASRDTGNGNAQNTYNTTMSNLNDTRNTSNNVNGNNWRTGNDNRLNTRAATIGNGWNSYFYGRGLQEDSLGVDWMKQASAITDAKRGPQVEVSTPSGDAAPDIWRQRGIQVRAMRQPDDVIRRCGDQMLLHGYTWNGVIEGDGFERSVRNGGVGQDDATYPYMSEFVYVKGDPVIYPDDTRFHNILGIHVKPSPEAIEQIRTLYRNGVTVWVDPDKIGDDIYHNEPILEVSDE